MYNWIIKNTQEVMLNHYKALDLFFCNMIISKGKSPFWDISILVYIIYTAATTTNTLLKTNLKRF